MSNDGTERRQDLPAEIRRRMMSGENQPNITSTAIQRLMEQLNEELRNLCTQSPPLITRPIQEESRDNIHHELHTSTECSSPSPELNLLEYHVIADTRARHGSGGSAVLLASPHNVEE